MDSTLLPATCWRRGFYQTCPEAWHKDYIIWASVFAAFYVLELLVSLVLFFFFFRAWRNMEVETKKKNMQFVLIVDSVLIATLVCYCAMNIVALATDGEPYSAVFTEILIISPYAISATVLYPLFITYIKLLANFADSPLATSLAKLSFFDSNGFKVLGLLYTLLFFIVMYSTGVISALYDEYYFTMVRTQTGVLLGHYVILAVFSSILGFSVIHILTMTEESAQKIKAVGAEDRARTLKYMKFQTRTIVMTALSLIVAISLAIYMIIQYPEFDRDELGAIVVYSMVRGSFGLQIPSLQFSLYIYYWAQTQSMFASPRRNTSKGRDKTTELSQREPTTGSSTTQTARDAAQSAPQSTGATPLASRRPSDSDKLLKSSASNPNDTSSVALLNETETKVNDA